jgi:hypothetical protein
VRGSIIIGHGPCHREKTKEKGESSAPAAAVDKVPKDPTSVLLVRRKYKEGNAYGNRRQDVYWSKPKKHLVECLGRKRADGP